MGTDAETDSAAGLMEEDSTVYETIFRTIDDAVFLVDVEHSDGELSFTFRRNNAAHQDLTGLAEDELRGQTPRDLLGDEGGGAVEKRYTRCVEAEETIEYEETLDLPGGKREWATKLTPIMEDGAVDQIVGVARDITKLKEYKTTLERQRDNLDILNQVVRHDIRNDLQLVLAYTQTLEDHVDEEGEEYVRQVLSAAREAVTIIETARDVTELLLQEDPERRPVSLHRTIQQEVEEVRSSVEQALIEIDRPLPSVDVLADDMLGSVFRNLLKNAVVHNDKDIPEVTVSGTTEDGIASIRVADNGPGIPPDQRDRIFEEGEQGLDSDGTGLGLYLVQTLVDRYEGEVWVADNDPEGVVFVVELDVVSEE